MEEPLAHRFDRFVVKIRAGTFLDFDIGHFCGEQSCSETSIKLQLFDLTYLSHSY
jgi:hypothetical protein